MYRSRKIDIEKASNCMALYDWRLWHVRNNKVLLITNVIDRSLFLSANLLIFWKWPVLRL